MIPLVSVSVPVYNVENYLRRCLDSLQSQTLQNIEIILVDDGSTDNSGAICDEYAVSDSRFKVIHKPNGGLASARQTALDTATGKYLAICDSDDWIEPDMYEKLYAKAEATGSDIVMCDYVSEYAGGRKIVHNLNIDLTNRNDLLGDALNGFLPCQVWNKLFRREFFEKHNISWEPNINLGEDFMLMLKILQYPVNIVYVNTPFYHYWRNMNSSSYTNNITMRSFHELLFIRQWVQLNLDTEKYAGAIFRLWLNLAFTGLRVDNGMDRTYYHKTVMSNLPLSGFFKLSYPRLKGCLIFITKIFGYNTGRLLYKINYNRFYR